MPSEANAQPQIETLPGAESEPLLFADLVEIENTAPTLEELVERDTNMGKMIAKLRMPIGGTSVTGGDLEDDWYQAEVVGEEAVGGQTPTPDQNVTEDLLNSMGIASTDGQPVKTLDKMEQRDRQRWELDPESSEDYQEHSK
ncbi:MAG: hypothetical protein F6K19_41945 [Cyanothece sp. SIO1E1]|nr:hypothetical protein [Cyanothece sp. SIO1E1]